MQIMVMLEDFHEKVPEGAELEEFLAHPKHHLARLIRDLFADEAAATTMEVSLGTLITYYFPLARKGALQPCSTLL